jgi:hypothetical protein
LRRADGGVPGADGRITTAFDPACRPRYDAVGIHAIALWFGGLPGSGTHDTIILFSMACEAYDVFR